MSAGMERLRLEILDRYESGILGMLMLLLRAANKTREATAGR